MIKLIGFLFAFTAVYAHERIFYLPDHHTRFIHFMSRSFKNSEHILILTPSLSHSELKKELLSAVKKGSTLHLITHNSAGDPLSLVQYRNIELSLSPLHLAQSAIVIDDTLVCTSDGAIEEDFFRSSRSRIRCSDNPQNVRAVRKSFQPLIQRAKNYLE